MLVLLIYNSHILMDITKKILEREGHKVICAADLAAARKLIADEMPDGIIIENEMPDGNGLDFCRELRRGNGTPIMLVSGSKEDEIPALSAGANDFMKKPFDFDIMKARISAMMEARGSARNGEQAKANYAESLADGQANEIFVSNQEKAEFVNESGEDKEAPKRIILTKMSTLSIVTFCIALTLAGTNLPRLFKRSEPAIDLNDDPVPLGAPTIKDGFKAHTANEVVILIPEIKDLIVAAGETDVELLITNPIDNMYSFTFGITLKDTGEIIYSSSLVEPGKSLEEITLDRELEAGEHKAVLAIDVYDMEALELINEIRTEFRITVE